jgi:membrane protein involved in D-alanine export
MRFLLAAAKGKWFKNKHTASYVGLYITFGTMGLWHGTEWYYLLYGVYHATLLSAYDWFARWNKTRNWLSGGRIWNAVNILLTFHAIAFGLLLFSGRLAPKPLPEREERVEVLNCQEISGYIWDKKTAKTPTIVDISMDGKTIGRVTADEYREELYERGMGTGHYGFHFTLPASVRDGREHWVMPVVVATPPRVITGPDIPDQPYILHCPAPEKEGAIPSATPAPALATPSPGTPTPPVPSTPAPSPAR